MQSGADNIHKRITIRDVANEAGVSLTTVSHALNGYDDVSEKTRKKVEEIAKRLDYIPDENGRALKGKPRKTIAFLVAGILEPNDPSGIVYGVMSGIYAVAQERGYEFEIVTAPRNVQAEMSLVQLCRKKNIMGVVVYGLETNMIYYEQIPVSKFPCVLVDVKMDSQNVREVSVDNVQASFDAVEHLILSGYENIAMLTGKKLAQVSVYRERGYRKALEQYGFTVREEWLAHCDFYQELAFQKAMELKHHYPEIDAFFCINDNMAIGAAEGMFQLGMRVPTDVGIVGFDDYPITKYIYGGITTIRQKPYEMGVVCARTLIDMLEGKEVPSWVEVAYQLQKRASTKRINL